MPQPRLAQCLCLLLLISVGALAERDLYEVLGVPRDATQRQIKRAYRKLSVKYHPDKNQGDEAAKEKFLEVTHAFEILSDEEKKFLYDDGGEKAVEEFDKGEQAAAHDPFAAFFGGGGRRRNAKKGPDAEVAHSVTLEDLYNGKTLATTISRLVHCRGCQGRHDGECGQCTTRCPNEVKTVLRQVAPGFNVQQQQEVASKEKCKMGEVTLDIDLERGMKNGDKITFKGKSEQRPGLIPGDVHLVLNEQRHHRFTRDGDDLRMTMHITLKEALTGFKKTFRHLDNHEVTVASSRPVQPFQTMKLEDEGMPVHNFPSQKGKLYVKLHVDFPAKLNEAQRTALQGVL